MRSRRARGALPGTGLLLGVGLGICLAASTASGAPAGRPAAVTRPAAEARPAPEARPAAGEQEKPGGKAVALPIFKEGIALFDGGDYYGAIQKFTKAYFHFPSPNIHTRIALSYKWLRNHLKAIEHYEQYLAQTRPKTTEEAARLPEETRKLREEVQKTLEELLKSISQLKLTLTKPPGAELRINGRTEGRGPQERLFRFNPGPVVVEVTAKEHTTFRQELRLVAGQTLSLQVALDPLGPSNRGGGAAADSI